jgi:hypothetical protein
MGVRVLDDLAPVRDVKLYHAIEVDPSVHLLWAHLVVHILDELFLVTQMHAPLADDLDPLPILKQGSISLMNFSW